MSPRPTQEPTRIAPATDELAMSEYEVEYEVL